MSGNEFEDLRRKRKAAEAKQRETQEAVEHQYRLQAQQDEQKRRLTREAFEKYHPMVSEIMSQLKDAAYPNLIERVHFTVFIGVNDCWELVRERSVPEEDGARWVFFDPVIRVKIDFDSQYRNAKFKCIRYRSDGSIMKTTDSKLNKDDLVKALKNLH